MLFTSSTFAIFLVIVFCLYWLVLAKRRRAQNALLLTASYVFYGWWDWRFLSLIALSSVVDYAVAQRMGGRHATEGLAGDQHHHEPRAPWCCENR